MKSHGTIDAFRLKNIMLALMVLDHAYYYLFPQELIFAHYAARVVAPVFAFLAAGSMVHTSDRRRYIARLFAFGAVMAAGNIIISLLTRIEIANNIFLSLAVGAALIYCIDKAKDGKNALLWFSICVLLVYASSFCEGKYLVPMMMVIFYYLRDNRPLMYLVYVLLTGLPFIVALFDTGDLQPQFFMIFAVVPIMLYNGRRGPDSAFAKYFFYLIYPLHVWIIVLIKYFAFTS